MRAFSRMWLVARSPSVSSEIKNVEVTSSLRVIYATTPKRGPNLHIRRDRAEATGGRTIRGRLYGVFRNLSGTRSCPLPFTLVSISKP